MKWNFESMMLQVLDDPGMSRIIVETKYPKLDTSSEEKQQMAYFMIDRSNGGGDQKLDDNGQGMTDENGNVIWDDPKIYDYWAVSDNLGNAHDFLSHVSLLEFLDSISDIITEAHVESF